MTTKSRTRIFHYPAIWALVLVALLLAGCSSAPKDSGDSTYTGLTGDPTNATPGMEIPNPEILQAGDSVMVIYNDLPIQTMPWEGEIKSDGSITLILNQTFKAAGLTRSQLENEIRERYVPRFYKQMTVTVKPKQDTRFYYVGGEVRSTGRQIYLSRITILKAIQTAGDFNDFAQKKKVQLTRSGASKPVIINCIKAMQDSALDVEIHPGDKIHVPRRIL